MSKQSISGIFFGMILSISFFVLVGISPIQLLSAFIDNTELEFDSGSYVGTDFDSGNSWVEIATTTNAIALPGGSVSTGWFDMSDNVALWHFDETTWSGTTSEVVDSSSNSYHLTAQSAAVPTTSGHFQKAFEGDATADYLFQDHGSIQPSDTEGAISIWFNANSFTDYQYLFAALDDASAGNYMGIAIGSDALPYFYHIAADSSDDNWIKVDDAVSANVWNHFVVVSNGSDYALYLNGVEVSASIVSASYGFDNGDWFGDFTEDAELITIGAFRRQTIASPNYFFDGEIDEVALFDEALTASEVAHMYSQQSPTYAGSYDSQIFDAGAITDWTTLSWTSSRPYSAPLPNNEAIETAYTSGNLDMSDNTHLYHFDETSGVSLADDSGNSKVGTINSGTVGAEGKFDKALALNGTGDYAYVSSPSLPTTDFTYMGWINLDNNTDESIVYASDGTGANELLFNIIGANTLRVRLNNSAVFDGNAVVPTGVWTHFAVTRSGSTVTSYINGALDDTGTDGTTLSFSTCALLIGVDGDSGGCSSSLGNYFDGRIDELAIFSSALDISTIQDSYLRGALDLGMQVRTCDDAACSGEVFGDVSGVTTTLISEITHSATSTPSIALSQTANRYFQYRTFFGTASTTHSPELLSVTLTTSTPSVTWDGGAATNNWCDADNWSSNSLPTDAEDATIDTAVTVSTDSCADGAVDFNSLTIGGTVAATLDVFADDFGTVGDITIANLGTLKQNTSSTLTISGDFTVESNGTLTHADNSTNHAYSVNISATNIDIQSGATVDADALGFDPGGANADGYGPGGGDTSSNLGGGGAGHGGNGGDGNTGPGGLGYCDITNPATIGSGGAGGGGAVGTANGGGLIVLVASGTLTIDGTITADADVGATYRSGAAGGGIKLSGAVINGSSTEISAIGSNATTLAGGGGGGCVLVEYSTSNTIVPADVDVENGTGSIDNGGAGMLLFEDTSDSYDGLLYINGSSAEADTLQNNINADYIALGIFGGGNYVVSSTETLTLYPTSTAFLSGSTGGVVVYGTSTFNYNQFGNVSLDLYGTFINSSTLIFGANADLFIRDGAIITSNIETLSTSADVIIYEGDSNSVFANTVVTHDIGTITLYDFTTTTPLTVGSIVMNGGTLTHGDNSTTQEHVLHLVADSFTLESGATIDADGLGYDRTSTTNGAGTGPGAGGAGTGGANGGGGSGHAGVGGAGNYGAGGPTYCDTSAPVTIGSGGSAGANVTGASDGGGLIMLNISGTAMLSGTITADASPGSSYRAGGSGGGIHIVGGTVTGTPSITATGGNATVQAGGGGGGCVAVSYTSTSSISSATVSGGTGSYEDGADGTFESNLLVIGPVWTGDGVDNDWCTADNWAQDSVPTDSDDAVIDAAVTVTTSGCSAGEVDFSTLTLGENNATTLDMEDVMGTVGSMTIKGNGTFEQNTSSTLTLTGTVTVESGGEITHADNSTTHAYSVNIVAANMDIQSGGIIDVDAAGYSSYNGPGVGGTSAGGAHGGNGGNNASNSGGIGYCNVNAIDTIGSSGGTANAGKGGGLVSLNITDTLTVNGTITADAGAIAHYASPGGAGGGIQIIAATVTGTPSSFTAVGSSGHSTAAGAGGGGCVNITYTDTNSIAATDIAVNGGTTGYQKGGAGLIFIKDADSGDDGDLIVKNTVSSGADTPQFASVTYDSVSVYYGTYSVPSAQTLTLNDADPFIGDTNGKIEIEGILNALNAIVITGGDVSIESGTFNNNAGLATISTNGGLILGSSSTLSTTIPTLTTNGLLYFYEGFTGTITDLTIAAGTVSAYNYTTSTPLTFDDVIISGGTLTHGANTTAQTHVLNVAASSMDIQSGGTIDVDGAGYYSYNGPGVGQASAGGGHGGDGGDSASTAGGAAYCDINSVDTIGSSGGTVNAGNGGGLVMLNIANTLTIEGTITADGGPLTHYASPGGAGGGVNITAGTVTGTPASFTAIGSNGHPNAGGGGGGGCILISYETSTSIDEIGDVSLSGGTGKNAGNIGLFLAQQLNDAPVATIGIPVQTLMLGTVSVTTTINDTDNNDTSVTVEYSTDGISWASSTLGTITPSEGTVTTSTGGISSIDTSSDGSVDLTIEWIVSTDIPDINDSSVYLRITPNDGIAEGTTVTSTAFTIDTAFDVIGGAVLSELGSNTMTFSRPSPTSSDANFFAYGYYISTSTPALGDSAPEWGTGDDSNLLDSNWNGVTTTQATGMTPNTLYYITFVGYDTYINSTTTPEISTTTHAIIPNAVTFGSTSSSIYFIWGANGNSTGTVYEAEHIESATVVTTTDVSYEFSDALYTPGEQQNFRVRAVNSAGVYTAYTTGYTSSGLEVPDAPTVAITGTSTLDVTFGDTANGISTTYALYNVTEDSYIDSLGAATSTPVYQASSTWGTSIGVKSLIGNTSYSFETVATLLGSYATSSASTSTYTFASAPTIVGGSLSTSSVQLALINDGGATTLHDLTNLTLDTTVTSSDGIFNISGLTPNTTYFYQARVFNGDGVASASSTSSTVVTYAVPPTTVTATVNSATEIGLTWDDSGATQYKVFQDESLFASVSLTSATATGLTCETSYDFAVVAHNALDVASLTSSTVSATTSACPVETEDSSGGSFIAPSVPSLPSTGAGFEINNGSVSTDDRQVTLSFNVQNAAQVALSNSLNFSNVSFVPFAGTLSHMISAGNGMKTVYAKIRSIAGGTLTISDTIQLVGQLLESDESINSSTVDCSLARELAYSVPGEAGIYYITPECTKRPFKKSDIFFTYFTSYDAVIDTTQSVLDSIADDTLGFMPLGPLYNPASGALIKLPNDPKVYLLLGGTIYHIANEEAAEFQFGPAWTTWIDTVDGRVKNTYEISSVVIGNETRPDGILIKYPDSNKVYQLETIDGEQVKRWIPNEDSFNSLNFRWDRIVTISMSEVYVTGNNI